MDIERNRLEVRNLTRQLRNH